MANQVKPFVVCFRLWICKNVLSCLSKTKKVDTERHYCPIIKVGYMVLHWCNSFPPRWLKCKHSPDKSQMLMCPDVLEVLTHVNSLPGQLRILIITVRFYFVCPLKVAAFSDVFGCTRESYAWEQIPLNMPFCFSNVGHFICTKQLRDHNVKHLSGTQQLCVLFCPTGQKWCWMWG